MPSPAPSTSPAPELLLHIGCGEQRLAGWVNIDRQALPGVDRVLDVTRGLPFEGASAVFAEHFLEHLPLDHALAFLREAHRALAPGGWLRLSTPNLDWVLATQYPAAARASDAAVGALRLNRAFYAWSHRFLWNRALLEETLRAVGFDALCWCRWGESERPLLRGLERHATDPDSLELPHVLIVEARKGAAALERFAALRARFAETFLDTVRPLGWQLDPGRSRLVAHLPLAGPLGRWLREHLLRAAWIGGSVRSFPEAPAETDVQVDILTAHVLADEPVERLQAGLRPMPRFLRHRLEARFRGPRYLDADRQPVIEVRSTSVAPLGGGGLALRGELRRGEARVPIALDVDTRLEDGSWRARGELRVRPSALGLPPWRPLGPLLHAGDELRIELDLVATPVLPT